MAREAPRAARGQLGLALATVALAVLLAIVAAWAAGRLRERSETDSADARLASSLRAATAEMRTKLGDAASEARVLAATPAVERGLQRRDRAALSRLAASHDHVTFVLPNGVREGAPNVRLQRAVVVTGARGAKLGTVFVGVPVDGALVQRLRSAAGLQDGDAFAVTRNGRSVTHAPEGDLPSMSTDLASGTDLQLVASAPEDPIAAAAADTRRRVFFAALLTLGLAALAWWSIARFARARPPEAAAGRRRSDDLDSSSPSRRAREAVALVGEALAATHDPDALLPVIVESAVGATGAVGARLVSEGTERARAGDPESGGPPLSVSLGT
jgi:hypothetical protein